MRKYFRRIAFKALGTLGLVVLNAGPRSELSEYEHQCLVTFRAMKSGIWYLPTAKGDGG